MIHDKIVSGKFLLDLKTDQSTINLHHTTSNSQIQKSSRHMDIYATYAYKQQLQKHFIGKYESFHRTYGTSVEVLDLSRHCDSVETPRKTPSPFELSSSGHYIGSPAASSTSSNDVKDIQQFIADSSFSQSNKNQQSHLELYPTVYYPRVKVKQEPLSISPPLQTNTTALPRELSKIEDVTSLLPVASTSLLHTFASAESVSSTSNMKHISGSMTQTSGNMQHTSGMLNDSHLPVSSRNMLLKKSPSMHNTTTFTSTPSDIIHTTLTRPFKTFPRDPLVIAANFAATDMLLDNPHVERYTEYRKRVLEQIRSKNGGSRTITNPKMRRTNSHNGSFNEGSSNNSENEERVAAEESSDCDSNVGNCEKLEYNNNENLNSACQVKDAAYFERRRKNNAAAKKSRDRRRIKEDEIAIRAAYLERQNIELLCQIDALKTQLACFTSNVGS
ncbi:protein giant-like [Teleopsis dalmanni]|uniref:protein giant-like n=1 Tax=Teleopsis dalmanni TaxID=139649 RepID=UPI0018CD52CE|nr:protein giant-like [Teleopsis dalmanni]